MLAYAVDQFAFFPSIYLRIVTNFFNHSLVRFHQINSYGINNEALEDIK